MKKVVLLGDSIRLGYGPIVAEMCKGKYDLWQPDLNCSFADYTLRMLWDYREYLKGADIIHWNNGLWDLGTFLPDGETFTPIDDYVRLMVRIARILKMYAPKVIFATTTPVLDANEYETNEKIELFNARVVPALEDEGIIINDLHGTVYANREEYIIPDDMVHLTPKGYQACADAVYSAIEKADKE